MKVDELGLHGCETGCEQQIPRDEAARNDKPFQEDSLLLYERPFDLCGWPSRPREFEGYEFCGGRAGVGNGVGEVGGPPARDLGA